jgi:hypothetical protein
MSKNARMLFLFYLFGCVALASGIAEASTFMATGSGCDDSIAFQTSVNSCRTATGSCNGSPCSSITCTFTMNDGTVRGESYTSNPPLSNPACASTFCKSKCQ